MKTEVEMKRRLFNEDIRQKSKSEFFSATDLVRAGNKFRRVNGLSDFNLAMWLKTKQVSEFIEELTSKYGKVYYRSNRTTWVHPLLFIDLALAINPKLKIEVYEWLFDQLIKHRNDSGDSYKEMSASLYIRHKNHQTFPQFIQNVAKSVKDACAVKDWQTATEEQLKKRDRIHYSIKTLCSVLDDPNQAVRLGILESIKKI